MKFSTLTVLLLFFSGAIHSYAQDTEHSHDFRVVFEEIQHGLELGSVAIFSPHLSAQVQVALKGGESGYYSANHAYYLIEDYLKTHRVVSFEFTHVGETEATPFATGTAVFNTKGMRETAQVYVALTLLDEHWVIAEINIY